jgi:hypothetical protein
MGLLFRKRLRLGKFLSINLSKSGVGLSVGPPGAKLSLNPRRARMQIGIPGTGIGYRRDVSLTSHQEPAHAEPPVQPETPEEAPPAPHVSIPWFAVFIIGLLLGLVLARVLFR